MIKNRRILITGGAGSIGSELARQLAPNNKIFILDISERHFTIREELKQAGYWVHSRTGDVRDKDTVRDVFTDFKPEITFHAAALKHVTPNQEYPSEAIDTNINGTENVVAEAKRWECLEKFVFISTDKVVNAKCIMGITKLCAEGIVKLAGEQFVAVRFGNVMGSSGSLLEIWDEQFKHGLPLTITDPTMERYMMSIPQACELVIEAAEFGENGEVWVMDMGERKNILELKNELYGDYPTRIIGVRPGETLTEGLMTSDERQVATQKGKFWVLNG